MPALIAMLSLRLRLPGWVVTIGLALLLIGAAILGWKLWLHMHDQKVIDDHEIVIRKNIEIEGRKADENLAARAARDAAAQKTAREKFDNASNDIPRSGLSDRQRLDACNELRAQGTDPTILATAGCVPAGAAPETRSGGSDRQR